MRGRDPQGGFTLIELLMGIALSSIFAIGLFAFFFSGIDSARTSESQARAQAAGRTTIDRLARDIRQSVSPDGGVTAPIISLSPTSLELYDDPSRTATDTIPRPQKVRYSIVANQLIRESADPVGATAPFTYGSYTSSEVMLESLSNGATAAFSAVMSDGDRAAGHADRRAAHRHRPDLDPSPGRPEDRQQGHDAGADHGCRTPQCRHVTHGAAAPQAGVSLITTIAITGILALLVLASLSFARSSTQQTARQGRTDIALQVADAGVNQYASRLVEDPRYYDHWIDTAEDPRIDPTERSTPPAPPGRRACPGPTPVRPRPGASCRTPSFGTAAYSLRITPPASGSDLVTIQSTGQSNRNSPKPVTRSVQSQIHPSSIADFQIISNATIHYGSTATTTGKLYSAVDINHEGVAKAPAYAQRYVCSTGSSTGCSSSSRPSSVYQAGAYDSVTSPSFPEEVPDADRLQPVHAVAARHQGRRHDRWHRLERPLGQRLGGPVPRRRPARGSSRSRAPATPARASRPSAAPRR